MKQLGEGKPSQKEGTATKQSYVGTVMIPEAHPNLKFPIEPPQYEDRHPNWNHNPKNKPRVPYMPADAAHKRHLLTRDHLGNGFLNDEDWATFPGKEAGRCK